MMNIVEEAIIYATIKHQGVLRKFSDTPYILHPLEVAQIISTLTDDREIITAGILHDVVEDTDGTLEEIEEKFGKRVRDIVSSESENKYPEEDPHTTWKRRKDESLQALKRTTDTGVRMLWLADKLANIRTLARMYSEHGDAMWANFNQSDPTLQCWYYTSIAEQLELSFNKTGAFKELIKHINFIWPGTFASEKTRFMKYKEVSIDGCSLLGSGAKGDVYRYDDELIIKVFNGNNTYHDVEQEIAQARKSFILGLPSAISFGIVSVGDRYGAMFEVVDSDTLSRYIARSPGQLDTYAKIMADLALLVHDTKVTEDDGFLPANERVREYISGGVAIEDETLGRKCMTLIDNLPVGNTLVHGDFHTNNVFLQDGEPLLIDMDRVSVGNPIIEISDLYYFYVILGEDDPTVVENFMGFSYDTSKEFFTAFLKHYLGTEDEERLKEVTDKAALLGYSRLIRKFHKTAPAPGKHKDALNRCLTKISELSGRVDSLAL